MSNRDISQVYTRIETVNKLKALYEKGYRYVVRDQDIGFLICFSLKPKKYKDTESWGYIDSNTKGVIAAYPIKNSDISEINWSNRSATLISIFLDKENTLLGLDDD